MRAQLRIGSGLCWTVAWLLALAGPAVYVLSPGDATWWVGLVLVVPLVGLVAWRQEHKGYGDGTYGAGDGGMWAPPP
jgi:hypothetical protein